MSVQTTCITSIMSIELRAYDLDAHAGLFGHRYWQMAHIDQAHAGNPATRVPRDLPVISLTVSHIHNKDKGDSI